MPHWTLWLALGLFFSRLTSFLAARRIGALIRVYLEELVDTDEPTQVGRSNGNTVPPA